MFCDGKCIKGGKKCGLLLDITMREETTGKIETRQMCVLEAILNSSFRVEQALVRIQAAIESQRNEEVKTGEDISKTVANGFLGLIQAYGEDTTKTKKLVDNLVNKVNDKKLVE